MKEKKNWKKKKLGKKKRFKKKIVNKKKLGEKKIRVIVKIWHDGETLTNALTIALTNVHAVTNVHGRTYGSTDGTSGAKQYAPLLSHRGHNNTGQVTMLSLCYLVHTLAISCILKSHRCRKWSLRSNKTLMTSTSRHVGANYEYINRDDAVS